MKCPNCGAEIKSNLKFCNKCGTLITTAPSTSVTTQYSPVSSMPTNQEYSNASTVSQAGQNQSSAKPITQETVSVVNPPIYNRSKQSHAFDNQPVTQHEDTKKKRKKKNKFFAGFLAILFGFFGIHWFYLNKPIRGFVYILISFVLANYLTDFYYLFLLFCIGEGIYMLSSRQDKFEKYIKIEE